MSKSYSFASYAIEASEREPFRLDVGEGDDAHQIVIPCPDVDTTLAIDEAVSMRERLLLYTGDQYDEVRKLLSGKHPATLNRLVLAMARHFAMDVGSGN